MIVKNLYFLAKRNQTECFCQYVSGD